MGLFSGPKSGERERSPDERRDLARITHAAEQGEAQARAMGSMLAGMWLGLRDGGVPPKDATAIVAGYASACGKEGARAKP